MFDERDTKIGNEYEYAAESCYVGYKIDDSMDETHRKDGREYERVCRAACGKYWPQRCTHTDIRPIRVITSRIVKLCLGTLLKWEL